jgi:hypothetical protein
MPLDVLFGRCRVAPRCGQLCGELFGDAYQVVSDQVKHEVSGDAIDAAMLGLAHGAVRLAPAEDGLDHRLA